MHLFCRIYHWGWITPGDCTGDFPANEHEEEITKRAENLKMDNAYQQRETRVYAANAKND